MAIEDFNIHLSVHSYGNDGEARYERTCSGCGQVSIVKKRYLSMTCHQCAMKDKRDRLSPGSVQVERGGKMITLYERVCSGCGLKSLAAKKDRHRMCRICALKARSTHGLAARKSTHPLYRIIKSAVYRCTNSKSKDYGRYGARGIRVCDDWANNPESFAQWAFANGYADGMELDRIDNDGDYSPLNCRFVSHAENCRNKSTNKMTVELVRKIRKHALESGSIKQTAIFFGIPTSTAGEIIRRTSWADVE